MKYTKQHKDLTSKIHRDIEELSDLVKMDDDYSILIKINCLAKKLSEDITFALQKIKYQVE